MSVRSASRGSPAASSIRLALRTSSIVATRRASFVRWVLRCFGRRRLSSSPKLPAISLMPSMMRFQVPPRADSLNHTPTRHVNKLLLKLIDGKPTTLCRWVGEIVQSSPEAGRLTLLELIVGALLASGGHVTQAILALTPRLGWQAYHWMLERGRFRLLGLISALCRI